MKWLLVPLIGVIWVLGVSFGLYRLSWQESLRNGVSLTKREPFLCFYGFHSWYIDDEVFSWVRRCQRCSVAEDKLALQRLEYERKIWGGDLDVRNASPWAAREHVQAKLREWDRENHFFHVEALN